MASVCIYGRGKKNPPGARPQPTQKTQGEVGDVVAYVAELWQPAVLVPLPGGITGHIFGGECSEAHDARRTVLALPLSSSGTPRPPLAIQVECLGRKVVAVCDRLRAVDKSRLLKRAGALTTADLEQIEDGLRQILSL
jgi:hypothetical protein